MDTRFKGTFIVLLRVTLWFSLFSEFEATDVYMNCPADPWVIGKEVTFNCSALKSEYPSQCTSTNREVEFRRSPNDVSYSATCSLADVLNTCTSSSPACTCSSSNSTHHNFQYTFSISAVSSGYWDCNIPCLSGVTPQLTYSSSADCKDRDVTVGPCDGVNCENSGTCYVDDNQAKCNCSGTNYKGDFCETHICDGKDCNQEKCYVDGETATCDCTGMFGGDDCSDLIEELVIIIALGCVLLVAVVSFFIVVIFRLWWKRLFSCVICVIVCVDNETKKKKLHTEKGKVEDFVSEHFIMHCCCCCCCSWLGWCCLGRLMWRGKKGDVNDGRVEGGTVKRSKSMGCSMGCLWCLSSVQNVKVDVHDIEDNQVSVLITLTSPLSWYSEADDMAEKVKEYIRTEILKERGREQCHTSKPSTCFGFGCIAGSPDTRNEPPAVEQSHTSKPSTCFGFGCIAGSPDPSNEPPAGERCHTSKPSMHLGVGCIAGSPDPPNEPPADYNADSGR